MIIMMEMLFKDSDYSNKSTWKLSEQINLITNRNILLILSSNELYQWRE